MQRNRSEPFLLQYFNRLGSEAIRRHYVNYVAQQLIKHNPPGFIPQHILNYLSQNERKPSFLLQAFANAFTQVPYIFAVVYSIRDKSQSNHFVGHSFTYSYHLNTTQRLGLILISCMICYEMYAYSARAFPFPEGEERVRASVPRRALELPVSDDQRRGRPADWSLVQRAHESSRSRLARVDLLRHECARVQVAASGARVRQHPPTR